MKILVGSDLGSYTFNASAKTVTLIGFQPLLLSQVLLITNTTDGVIIYSPYSPGKGGTISGNILTLQYNTTAMDNSDSLQIFINYEDFVQAVTIADNGHLDAFGRQRTSSPHALFENANILNASPLIWENTLTSGGTVTHLPNEGAVSLAVTSTIGSKVVREQHGYNRYFPGKSQLVYGTAVVGTAVAGIRKRLGYFNAQNGFFFEQDTDGALYAVLRTFVSGSAVDNKVAQSAWNIDRLDGTGSVNNPSGILLDITKAQIFLVDFQWLGVGRVRLGTSINGQTIYVHEIDNANILTTTYMSTGSLPIRFEIENVSSGTGDSFKVICATVQSEGGEGVYAYQFSAGNGVTSKSIGGTRTQLFSLRLATTVSGNANRAKIVPFNFDIMLRGSDSVYYELILQRAHLSENNLGGAPTWAAINNSISEFSVNGTTITGGSVLQAGYVSGQSRTIQLNLDSKDFLALNAAGTTSDWLHIAVTNADTGSVDVHGSLSWREFY